MPEDVSPSNPKAQKWPSLSIVVPCFNELDRLDALHRELLAFLERWDSTVQIILVDDGSRDQSYDKMKHLFGEMKPAEVELIHYPDNQGKGYALQAGIQAAHHRYVLTMDADVATSPMMLLKWFTEPELIDPGTIYIGSREHRVPTSGCPGYVSGPGDFLIFSPGSAAVFHTGIPSVDSSGILRIMHMSCLLI